MGPKTARSAFLFGGFVWCRWQDNVTNSHRRRMDCSAHRCRLWHASEHLSFFFELFPDYNWLPLIRLSKYCITVSTFSLVFRLSLDVITNRKQQWLFSCLSLGVWMKSMLVTFMLLAIGFVQNVLQTEWALGLRHTSLIFDILLCRDYPSPLVECSSFGIFLHFFASPWATCLSCWHGLGGYHSVRLSYRLTSITRKYPSISPSLLSVSTHLVSATPFSFPSP